MLNKKGWELYNKWEHNYKIENDDLGGTSKNGDYIEGWCIIENSNWIKTIEDCCGLYIFGYDDNALNQIQEWVDEFGEYENVGFKNKFTYGQLYDKIKEYFE